MECNCNVTLPGPSLAGCGSPSLLLFMTVLEQFLRTQCDIEDPCGQITPPDNPLPKYDFIVVGAGSAGSVVASRLSEVQGWSVLLVEAGVNEPTGSQVPALYQNAQGTSIDWQYVTEPEPTAYLNTGGSTSWPRGKVIGGTSVLNNMNYVRGNIEDYDTWARLGNVGWSYQDVLPYFIKSENNFQIDSVDAGYHGVGGYMPVTRYPYIFPYEEDILRGAQELGQRIGDLNGENQLGFFVCQTTSRNGVRFSSARSFLRPVKNRRNLHILLNTLVTRVLIDPTTKQAFGVEVINSEGETINIMSKKEVVLSAGALGSPKILLLSGVGDSQLLTDKNVSVVHHLPGVGRNLHDHVGFRISFNTNQTDLRDLNWAVAARYLMSRTGPLAATGETIVGFIKSRYVDQSSNYPDLRLQFGGYVASCSETGDNEELQGEVENGEIPQKQVYMTTLLVRPKSRGFLTLRDNNPFSYPLFYPGYLSNPEDIPPLIDGIQFLLRLSQTRSLEKYKLEMDRTPTTGCENFTFGSYNYWRCAVQRDTRADYHQAGSCKMGPATDSEAVVDPQLRVYGVKGLRVADAGIMPFVIAGNTHAPTVMIGERAADFVKMQWLHPRFAY